MAFFDELLKRVRQSPSDDQGSTHKQSQGTREAHAASSMQSQGNEVPGEDPPVKEMRTYRRDGTTIIEEYERLNPDGTVTKTVSVGDKKDGLKKFEVYKMDKSGIVRRVDHADQDGAIPTGAVRDMWMEQLRRMSEQSNNRNKLGGENEYTEAPNTYRYSDETSQGNRPIDRKEDQKSSVFTPIKQYADSLGPERRAAIFKDYKDKLLEYGSSRLQHILKPKLDDKGKSIGLSDEQKTELLEYGTNKLRKLLNKSVDEERFFNEIWPKYEYLKNSTDNKPQESSSNKVSFVFQPNSDSTLGEASSKAKPLSFMIRPAVESNPNREPTSQSDQDFIKDQYHSFVNDSLKGHKINDVMPSAKGNERTGEDESVEGTFAKLEKHLKKYIRDDKSTDNADKQTKENFVTAALDSMKRQLQGSDSSAEELNNSKPLKSEKPKPKEEKSKKYDVTDLFDPEEIFDYGVKTLRKLLKKHQIETKENEDWEKHEEELKHQKIPIRRKCSYSNKGDNATDLQQKPRNYTLEELTPKEERRRREKDTSKQRDSDGFILPFDDIYMKSRKPHREGSPKPQKKAIDFDTYLSQIRENSSGEKESASRKVSKDDDYTSYTFRPELSTDARSESPKKKDIKSSFFDISDILQRFTDVMDADSKLNRKLSNQNEGSNDGDNNYFYQTRPLEVTIKKSNCNSTKQNEASESDTMVSKYKEKMSQDSNRESSSAPRQIKISSSYHKPQQASTISSDRNLGQQNGQNDISFQIRPKYYSKSSEIPEESFRKPDNLHSGKDEFIPWWFGNASGPNSPGGSSPKPPLVPKQPVNNSIFGDSFLGDSFFSNFLGDGLSKPQLTDF